MAIDYTQITKDAMIKEFETVLAEDEKFMKGNAAAGTRARGAAQKLAKLCKERRYEISEIKNTRLLEKESAKK